VAVGLVVHLEGEFIVLKYTQALLCVLCCAGVVGLFAGRAAAAPQVLYGATSAGGPGELYILNPASGAVVTDVGPLQNGATNYPVSGLAFNPITGVLYGSTGNSKPATAARLITIDPATATVTEIGQFNVGNGASMADLEFDSSGNLYGIATNGGANLFTINLLTAQATLVGASGFSGTAGGGLAISSGGVFYGTPISADFGTYNPATGAYTNIGTPGHPAGAGTGYAALAFDQNGVLYGDDLGATPHLMIINPADASTTDLGASVTSLDAIAFGPPIPEPGSLALLLAPAAAAFARRRRSH
jgi:hypothetical protein